MGGKREAGETKSPSKGTEWGSELGSDPKASASDNFFKLFSEKKSVPKPLLFPVGQQLKKKKKKERNERKKEMKEMKERKKKKERKRKKERKKKICLHGDAGSIPGREDPLQKEMAIPHSSFLAWETSRTEEPGGLQSMGSQKSDMIYD